MGRRASSSRTGCTRPAVPRDASACNAAVVVSTSSRGTLARRLQPTVAHDHVVACYFQLHNFRQVRTLVARECGECAAEVRRVQGDY